MKITDIEYKTLNDLNGMSRFDLTSMPKKPKWYLQVLAWSLSFPELLSTRPKINKHSMKDLKGPYILLCNHNSFVDFKVVTKAIFPRRANYIVAVDGFIGREKLMRNVGCLGKRKFVSDSIIIRQIKHTLEVNKVICEIYPEARYSLVGTNSMLPDSLGKMIKLLGYPVVTLISHGHHLRQPFWNLNKRKIRTSTDMTKTLDRNDIENMSSSDINDVIRKAFVYDDYKYQFENNIKISYINRAKNLHKVLYQCPHCKTEFRMNSDKSQIWCEHCDTLYNMDELGKLSSNNKETIFTHIPDWFEWQREQVKNQIKNDNYKINLEVEVDVLQNSDGFYRLGVGKFKHNQDGLSLHGIYEGEELSVRRSPKANFGIHIEFDYFGRGDGFSFSTKDNTYYLYPTNKDFSVTKLHFSVEELYKLEMAKQSK